MSYVEMLSVLSDELLAEAFVQTLRRRGTHGAIFILSEPFAHSGACFPEDMVGKEMTMKEQALCVVAALYLREPKVNVDNQSGGAIEEN